tara:strand:+ start:60 stop:383 length:324 start_codon:yes stop_codon:yes gene_type:complete
MNKIYKSLILTIFLATTSCESVKSALGGSKMNNSDEFLVEKKNPLVLPPDYSTLPEPSLLDKNDVDEDSSKNVEKLVLGIEEDLENQDYSPSDDSIEDFVRKKINKN